MPTTQAVDAVVKLLGPHSGDTMARSATQAHRRLRLLES
jgi:hypothetical protein